MSNNQYNNDPNSNFAGTLPTLNSQAPTQDAQRLPEGMPNTSTNQNPPVIRTEGENGNNLGQQNTANNYNPNYMGQNQSNSQPGFVQTSVQPTQTNYNQDPQNHAIQNSLSQPINISSNMVGQANLSNNQPPIGQRAVQSYPQPGFSGNQPNNQNINQNLGGMEGSSEMNQNYIAQNQATAPNPAPAPVPAPAPTPTLPPVSINSTPTGFNPTLGEKTYEPEKLAQNSTSKLNYVELLGIDPMSQKEFEEKSVLCKQYKQTDVFAAIQVKNEEDGLKIIDYLIKHQNVSLTQVDALDQTCLFYASRDGKLKILSILLEKG